MRQSQQTVTVPAPAPSKPDRMVTLDCPACRMALYMSERALAMPNWACPSCGAVTGKSARA